MKLATHLNGVLGWNLIMWNAFQSFVTLQMTSTVLFSLIISDIAAGRRGTEIALKMTRPQFVYPPATFSLANYMFWWHAVVTDCLTAQSVFTLCYLMLSADFARLNGTMQSAHSSKWPIAACLPACTVSAQFTFYQKSIYYTVALF